MRKLALILVFAGCGGGIDIEDLDDELIDSYCDIYVRCGIVPDVETCHVLLGPEFDFDQSIVEAVKAGKVKYDPDKARECLDSLGGSTCDRGTVFGNRNNSTACDETFTGTVGDMGECAIDQECISQNCNVPTCPTDTCCTGACVGGTKPTRPKVGEACGMGPSCSDGFCDSATLLCTAYLADGAACTSSNSCNSGVCNLTCQALVPPGGACMSSTQCRDIGNTCNSTSKTCVTPGGSGAACMTSGDCGVFYQCDLVGHTCISRPHLGEACTGSCIDGSFCDQTTLTCTARKADGAACMLSSECVSGRCDSTSNTCITPPVCF